MWTSEAAELRGEASKLTRWIHSVLLTWGCQWKLRQAIAKRDLAELEADLAELEGE